MNSWDMDLITIIIPVYNGERYLEECISSALMQTYKNLQLIIVNDGSTDNSKSIIQRFEKKDERILFIDKENSGVSVSRNIALNVTKGAYVCFLDQDDILENSYIEYLHSLIIETKSDISVMPFPYRFREKHESVNDRGGESIKTITGEKAIENMLLYKYVIAPWGKMISFNLIKENNISIVIAGRRLLRHEKHN